MGTYGFQGWGWLGGLLVGSAAIAACGGDATVASDPPGGSGNGSASGGSPTTSTGGGGVGNSGGNAGVGACGCEPEVVTQACFCILPVLDTCDGEKQMEQVVSPTCPGPMIYPITDDCEIGGLFYVDELDGSYAQSYFFDRDTGALVGMSYDSDSEICDGTEVIRWGLTTPSCELCDPCGGEPACP